MILLIAGALWVVALLVATFALRGNPAARRSAQIDIAALGLLGAATVALFWRLIVTHALLVRREDPVQFGPVLPLVFGEIVLDQPVQRHAEQAAENAVLGYKLKRVGIHLVLQVLALSVSAGIVPGTVLRTVRS